MIQHSRSSQVHVLTIVFISLFSASAAAAVFGDDDRRMLFENQGNLGLDYNEAVNLTRCTGQISCPGLKTDEMISVSAGAICSPGARLKDGKCSSDRLLTSAQTFIHPVTKRLRANIASCEFVNFDGFKSKLLISDLKIIDPKDAAMDPYQSPRSDRVAVRLVTTVPGCDPHDLAVTDAASVGSEMIAVTAAQIDHRESKAVKDQPLTTKCKIEKWFPTKNGQPGAIISACDVNSGGFGGLTYIRTLEGKLAVNSMMIDSPTRDQNGLAYNVELGKFTMHLTMSGDLLQLVTSPGVPPSLKP